jgi:hypothetical protein
MRVSLCVQAVQQKERIHPLKTQRYRRWQNKGRTGLLGDPKKILCRPRDLEDIKGSLAGHNVSCDSGYKEFKDSSGTTYRVVLPLIHSTSFQTSSRPHFSLPSAVMMLIHTPRPASSNVHSESGLLLDGSRSLLSGLRGRDGAFNGL